MEIGLLGVVFILSTLILRTVLTIITRRPLEGERKRKGIMVQITNQSAIGIQTKYLGATNFRGERIKAFTLGEYPSTGRPYSITLPYNYAFSGSKAHEPAMIELHNKLSHNPAINEWQEKECDHVAVSSGTDTGYIYIFKKQK